MPRISISSAKPVHRGTLVGFVTVELPDIGFSISDLSIHERHGKRWAQMPSMPVLDGGRRQRSENGKLLYVPIFRFSSPMIREAFVAAIVEAVERETTLLAGDRSCAPNSG